MRGYGKTLLGAMMAVGAMSSVLPAYSADMPRRNNSFAPAPIFTTSWAGFYAGGHLGYVFGRARSADMDGFKGGLQAGYNFQMDRLVIGGAQAVSVKLADIALPSSGLETLWAKLGSTPFESGEAVERWVLAQPGSLAPEKLQPQPQIDAVFGLPTVQAMLDALEAAGEEWSQKTAQTLRARSPLMLNVVLEQIRRARGMGLAEDLRMERDMVHHCFHLRSVSESETVEGIRALAVDKDHSPKWKPARVEAVDTSEVARFFVSPWPADHHPLRHLA